MKVAGRKGSVFLSLIASANLKGLDDVQKKLQAMGKQSKSTSSAFSGLGRSITGLISAGTVLSIGTKAVKEATEAFKTTAMTEQLLKNTGLAASVSAKQIGDLSMQISNLTGIDDEQVQAASNVLLGFKGLVPAGAKAQSTLANLTQVATDLGVKMGKDPAAGAKALGKALMDPAKAAGVLYRATVPLDKQTEARVKLLTKAGQVEQARALILQSVADTTKGLAAATADPMQRLLNVINNMLEALGTPFLNSLNTLAASFGSLFVYVSPLVDQLAQAVGPLLASGIKSAIPYLITLGKWFVSLVSVAVSLKNQIFTIGKLLAVLWVGSKVYAGVVASIKVIQLLTKAYRLLRMEGIKALVVQAAVTRGKSLVAAGVAATAALGAWVALEASINKTTGDMPDLTAGLDTAAVKFGNAAEALNIGAIDASKAAKAVGTVVGKTKTPKVKPKTATKPTTARAAADQSFMVAGSGGGVSLSVTINGSVVQERDVARAIRDELLQFARRQGVSPQFGV